MKQVLNEEYICKPGCGPDCGRDCGADEPWSIEINDDQHQHIYRPDAQGTAAIEVAEVVGLSARLKKDGSDKKAGKDKEEIDACPSPQAGVVNPCAFKARVAMIEDDGQNCEAAQAL